MDGLHFDDLLAVCTVAFAVPFLVGFVPRLRVPSVVVEILVGVVLGPTVLGWVRVDVVVSVLAILGLAFLLFLAGAEIDVRSLRGPTLGVAAAAYGLTVVLGLAVGAGLQAVGWVRSGLLVAVTLSATSLGLVVALLKDAGAEGSDVGRLTVAAATVADFAAVIALSLFFSATGGVGVTVALLGAFVVLAVVVALAVGRAGRSMRLGDLLTRLQDTTAQIRVRASMVLLVAFVALAARLGIETILGAFVAGALVATVDRDAVSHPDFRTKLDAIGHGFLVPVFFVASGIRLDLRGLVSDPEALLRVPVLLLALLLVRGLPAALFRLGVGGSRLRGREVVASGLLQATSLPFVVAATQIGVATGAMSTVTAAAFVCAGVLSVLVFPAIALALLRGARGASEGTGAVAAGAGAPP